MTDLFGGAAPYYAKYRTREVLAVDPHDELLPPGGVVAIVGPTRNPQEEPWPPRRSATWTPPCTSTAWRTTWTP
ncbi:hypothetical protein [Nonomuraea sp. B19D2]|uniref:hypothetical protein n=1 Tax=Nonomuraea sp. B19D2 TaxID=3159561 RepID=UPI0032DA93D1